jgi:xanthine dehydrogenase small subunit
MSEIAFLLNGTQVRINEEPATRTLLDWLRETQGLCGTKEGCNEGDCGACTVMVTDENGMRALNACILFLPQLDGKAVRTVEGINGPQGQLHPVQSAMIDHHGSQCGFCTPGFIVSMAVAHANQHFDHDTTLAGNLCRCTGYAPIVRAATAAQTAAVPDWMLSDAKQLAKSDRRGVPSAFRPKTTQELADWVLAHPQGVLIAGATDVGLWVTKMFQEFSSVAFLNGIDELRSVKLGTDQITIGAGVSIADLHAEMTLHHPSFAELLRRYASLQVRNAATIGGNIANGSPIGDAPPALIALGADLCLRRGDTRRIIALEDFFIAYLQQDLQPGEFVESVSIPVSAPNLRCYKLTKRFDQDISAVCGCFNILQHEGLVISARIAFGGMAGTPKRARKVEDALQGKPWTLESLTAATLVFGDDFQPLSDLRASSEYRLQAAQNMLIRYFHDLNGNPVSVLEVLP